MCHGALPYKYLFVVLLSECSVKPLIANTFDIFCIYSVCYCHSILTNCKSYERTLTKAQLSDIRKSINL